jgi:alkylated DNA repair dioxygenase AlkB
MLRPDVASFDVPPIARAIPQDLGGGAYIVLVREFLRPAGAHGLLRDLLVNVSWEQGKVRFFGREVPEPRLTAWCGDASYTYSGRTLHATPWPAPLAELRSRLETLAGTRFNSVLLNRYRTGEDSMGFHSDDEPELGRNPTIASLSLGTTRRFFLRPKRASAALFPLTLELAHGDLLIMGGTCQHLFRHAVPKQRAVSGERLNLTFRNLRHAAGGTAAG